MAGKQVLEALSSSLAFVLVDRKQPVSLLVSIEGLI
jgi:hypothetical protein